LYMQFYGVFLCYKQSGRHGTDCL